MYWGGLVALLVLLSFPDSSRAQCPDGSWTPGGDFTITIPGSSCDIEIFYCWKLVGGVLSTWVYEVDPKTSGCNTFTPAQLIRWGSELAMDDPYLIWTVHGITPCSKGTTTVQKYRRTCWKYQFNPAGGPQYVACDLSDEYCLETCKACYGDIGPYYVIFTDCYWQESGLPSCDLPPNIWPVGTCYSLGCGVE